MKFPFKARKEPGQIPYHPMVSPPIGSDGEVWDDHLEWDEYQLSTISRKESETDEEKKKPKDFKKLRPGKLRKKIYPTVTLAWICFLFMLITPPEMAFLLFSFAVCAILMGLLTFLKLPGQYLEGGRLGAIGALICVFGFLMIPNFERRGIPVRASIDEALVNATFMVYGHQWSVEKATEDMEKVAKIMLCWKTEFPTQYSVATRDYGAFRQFGPASRLWEMPAIPVLPVLGETDTSSYRVLRDLRLGELPKDPFSPGGQATFGWFEYDGWGLVYSRGPNRQFNYPMSARFRPEDPDFLEVLIQHLYDPTNGLVSSGDLLYPVWIDSELENFECEEFLENYRP